MITHTHLNPKNNALYVCIPANNEVSIIPVLQSLLNCHPVENCCVIVHFNASELASKEIHKTNERAFQEAKKFVVDEAFPIACYFIFNNYLPAKKAGVGLARKTCMDTAIELTNNKNAILLCLDADCTVESNYLQQVQHFFISNNAIAASIYFEHPIPDYEPLKTGIINYELHLRYLKNALQFTGYPWFYHTVGSSMAIRVCTYKLNGGMNTRQAGEDFHFLQKLMPLGFGEITTTCVYPEARYSERVPFGTGKSMLEWKEKQTLKTYNTAIFEELKSLFNFIHEGLETDIQLYQKHCSMEAQQFLEKESIAAAWHESVSNTKNLVGAKKRFWKWFSGIKTIRLIHHLRDCKYPNMEIDTAIKNLFELSGNAQTLLNILRHKDRFGNC